VQVGVDTGGTFTDLVTATGEVVKVLSTPDDPARAIGAAVGAATPDPDDRPALLSHGTTIATNALLERRGATVALVTTEGLRDVVEIGRQDRPSLYDQLASRPEPLVARYEQRSLLRRIDGERAMPAVTAAILQALGARV
jgi:N-methylhydantoinase A